MATHLPEDLEAVGRCTVGACNGAYEEGRHLTRKATVGISGGEVDDDSLGEVGTLGGVKRISESERTGVVLHDYYVLVFHNGSPVFCFSYTKIITDVKGQIWVLISSKTAHKPKFTRRLFSFYRYSNIIFAILVHI